MKLWEAKIEHYVTVEAETAEKAEQAAYDRFCDESPTIDEMNLTVKIIETQCPACGKMFDPRTGSGDFCSDFCACPGE